MKYFDPNLSPKMVNKLTLGANIITLTGSTTNGHTANITINGTKNTAIMIVSDSSLTTTAAVWCAANYDFYKLKGFLVTSSGAVITVNPAHSWGTTNTINATIATVTGTLTGTYTGTFLLDGSKARVWDVTFTTAAVNFATAVNMRNADQIKLNMVSTTSTTVTTSALVYANDTPSTTFLVEAVPVIVDAFFVAGATSITNGLLSIVAGKLYIIMDATLSGGQTGIIYTALVGDDGQPITDEDGVPTLIPETVYIY
jgi:hypothetical protein